MDCLLYSTNVKYIYNVCTLSLLLFKSPMLYIWKMPKVEFSMLKAMKFQQELIAGP